ncbi:hypothetical protein BH24ACT25_BH24ACT25_12890 [soil metagenome]
MPGANAPEAPRTAARFPDVPASRGHYESFYLKAGHPEAPLAVWIRYTIHKRPGARPRGSVWFTLFDARAGGPPRASKVTVEADRVGAGGGDYIRIADSRFAPGRVSGNATSEQLAASWDLELEPGEDPLRHLPRDWMYRAPVPRTKLESPHPATRFSGRVRVGDDVLELDGWPGMVGHNWGSEHAERWIWMHATGFEGHGHETWLDVAIGRIRLGRFTTPWVANGVVSLDGARHRLGGVERVRATAVEESPTGCRFVLPGREASVRGSVTAPADALVGWLYADPDGPGHHTVNCSIASMRLELRRPEAPPVELATASGATYELGMREHDHGVAIQPFPDG